MTPLYLLALTFLASLPTATSWTLVTRNSTDARVAHETTPQSCTAISHAKGQQFSFDPEGQWCLNFWKEDTCDNRIGWSCDGRVWKKAASQNISAFDVYAMPARSVSQFFPSSTTTTTGAVVSETGVGSASATPTAASTAQEGDEGGSLSSGAIAGVVVGAVAGVAGFVVLFFFLWRRKKAKAAASGDEDGDNTLPEGRGAELSGEGKQTAELPGEHKLAAELVGDNKHATTVQAAELGGGLVELQGNNGGAELSNSRQIVELDGDNEVKRPPPAD